MSRCQMIIGGKPVEARASFEVRNPATDALVGAAPDCGREELDGAVAAARAAFPAWAALPEAERAARCVRVAEVIDAHAEELARIVTAEQGKPLDGFGSRWEVRAAAAWARHTASLALEETVIVDGKDGRISQTWKPLGVVGSITPWNFPVMIAVWHILPAIRAGNAVVCKPSPFTPLATLRLAELLSDVLPPGVLNVVTSREGGSGDVGPLIASHPEIDKVAFTGSTPTGQRILEASADTVKRLILEMGGNDAGVVLPDVDPAAIAPGLFWGAFLNSGQTCAALKRLYVHEDVHDAVCEALVAFARGVRMGDGTEAGVELGPVQNRRQFDRVASLVEDARGKGEILIGGEPGEGLFYPVTIIAGLSNGDALVDREQFGPALPVIRCRDVGEAVALANDSPYGLGGSVWGRDVAEAGKVARRLRCGSVWVNGHGAIRPDAPFGGVKRSGLGVSFGLDGRREYAEMQVVFGP